MAPRATPEPPPPADEPEMIPLADSEPPYAVSPQPPTSTADDTDVWEDAPALDDVGHPERSVVPAGRPRAATPARVCSNCGERLAADAVLCVACGYNAQTGRTVKGAHAHGKSAGRPSTSAPGKFGRGFVLSGLGAFVAVGIWCAVEIITKIDVGIIALAIGALAGLGMAVGYRQSSEAAGFVAAGLSALGILSAKVILFVFFFYVTLTGNTADIELQRMIVANRLADQSLDQQEIWGEAERRAQWGAAHDEAEQRVAAMSDETVRAKWAELLASQQHDRAVGDEADSKRARVASNRVGLRAERVGLAYDDEAREAFYQEELAAAQSLSDAELNEALTQLASWGNGAKWDDSEYVCNHLVYQKIDQEIVKRQDGANEQWWAPSPEEWTHLYQVARAQVDALPPRGCTERARRLETEYAEELKRNRLVRHATQRRAESMGLAYTDPMRTELWAREAEKYADLTGESLDLAIKDLDAWERRGKWSDKEYVYDRLIYQTIDQAVFRQQLNRGNDMPGPAAPEPDEWATLYQNAKMDVDAIPEGRRVGRLRELEADREGRWERMAKQYEREEAKRMVCHVCALFFSSMFGRMDVIFLFLAVGTSYMIARGKSETE
jgi:hypothetical protein